jgi:hypothetical protein
MNLSNTSNWLLDSQQTEEYNESPNVKYILNIIDSQVKLRAGINTEVEGIESSKDIIWGMRRPDFTINLLKIHPQLDYKSYSLKTQKWVGHVIEIREDSFSAKLEDINDNTTFEIGEFDLDDVSYEDKELLTIGAMFYLSVGKNLKNGQIENKSEIRFQRLPNWNTQEIDNAEDRAQRLFENLNWE